MHHGLKLKFGETGLNFERLIGSDFRHDLLPRRAPGETECITANSIRAGVDEKARTLLASYGLHASRLTKSSMMTPWEILTLATLSSPSAIGRTAMRKLAIQAAAAALLLSLTSIPAVAQEINILGPGRGWKLLPQRGPEGQNVYGYDCGADFRRIVRHRVSTTARHARMVAR